jgi:hypothetical protein
MLSILEWAGLGCLILAISTFIADYNDKQKKIRKKVIRQIKTTKKVYSLDDENKAFELLIKDKDG